MKYRILETHTYVNVYEVEAEDEGDAQDNYQHRGIHLPEYDKDLAIDIDVEELK